MSPINRLRIILLNFEPLSVWLFILFLFAFGCNSSEQNKPIPKKLSTLSEWLINKEDSLLIDFKKYERDYPLQPELENKEHFHQEQQMITGLPAELTRRVNEKYPGVILYFQRRNPEKKPAILVSADDDRNLTAAVDSLFADIDSLRHFEILKFYPPGMDFSTTLYVNDTIESDKLFFLYSNINDSIDLIVYYNKGITNETQQLLIKDLFGEEILLKVIRSVDYRVYQYKAPENAISVEGMQKRFGIH